MQVVTAAVSFPQRLRRKSSAIQLRWATKTLAAIVPSHITVYVSLTLIVIMLRNSDGGNWSVDQGLIQPDADDPPELQFYRIRPFYVGNTTRLAAHVLNYAPGPAVDIVGSEWGHQPSGCSAGPALTSFPAVVVL